MTLRVLALLAILHALVGWAFLRNSGPGLPLDDAWGHLVYARAFAQGDGFAYNPGRQENGVTSPLWTLLAAVPAGLTEWTGGRARPDLGLRVLGGVVGLLVAFAGFRLVLRAGRWPALFVALVLTLDPLMVFSRFSGMELPLFALITLLLMEAVLDHEVRRTGLLCGLAVLVRPEGLLLAAFGLFIVLRQKRSVRAFLTPLLLCVLPFAAWCAWVSGGNPWPSTWSNKFLLVTDAVALSRSVSALAGDTGYAWALPVLLLVGTFALEGIVGRLATLPILIAGLLLAGVLFTRDLQIVTPAGAAPRIPFYWERYALLAWPALLVVVGGGLASVVRTAWAGTLCRPRAAAVLIAPLALVAVLAHGLPAHARDVSVRYAHECADVEALNVAAGRWIDGNLPADALVATHDAGAVRYFGRRPVLDIWGNNDSELHALIRRQQAANDAGSRLLAARAQEAIEAYLRRRRPDALACFPTLYAPAQSPELAALLPTLAPEQQMWLRSQITDTAGFLGLTRRAATFTAPYRAVVDSPLHETFAIFVRP